MTQNMGHTDRKVRGFLVAPVLAIVAVWAGAA